MVGGDERHAAVGAVVLMAQSFEHRQLSAAAIDEQKLRPGMSVRSGAPAAIASSTPAFRSGCVMLLQS